MNRDIQREIEKWAEGRPPFFVQFAVSLASNAADAAALVALVCDRHKVADVFERPGKDKDLWLSFYRKHRVWADGVCVATDCVDDDGRPLIHFLDDMRGALREARKDPDAFIEEFKAELEGENGEELTHIFNDTRDAMGEWVQDTIEEAAAEEDDADLDFDGFEEMVNEEAMQFMFRVWLPCALYHQIHPMLLYRKAKVGDLDALDALLRIDKMLLRDPAIMNHVVAAAYAKKRGPFVKLSNAIGGRPRGNMKAGKAKKRLAALVVQWSHQYGKPITAPDMQRLFDILAKHQGALIDSTLGPSPEAFGKGVQREKNWLPLPTDKI